MFRRTDPQATLRSLNILLSPKKIARLKKNHWAGGFRRKALPVLLANEETFRPLFYEDNGRPNKPVREIGGNGGQSSICHTCGTHRPAREGGGQTDGGVWTGSSGTASRPTTHASCLRIRMYVLD